MAQNISIQQMIQDLLELLKTKTRDAIGFQPDSLPEDLSIPAEIYHHLWILLYRQAHQILTQKSGKNFILSISVIQSKSNEVTQNHKTAIPQLTQKYLKITYIYEPGKGDARGKPHSKLPPKLMALHLRALEGKIYQTGGKTTLLFPRTLFN